jgi:transposase
MLVFKPEAEIYIRTGKTDMRKQINGLAALIQNDMKKSPFGGAYYLFCGRGRRTIKLLYWDRSGFALWQKKLEKHRFPWPEEETQARKVTAEQIGWLLAGIDFFQAHEELRFSRV